MTRLLIVPAILLASSALFAAGTTAPAPAKPAAKTAAKKTPQNEPAAEPGTAPNDDLTVGELTMADRVLTGTAACEFNQTVKIERLEGHAGNFKLTFDKKAYVVHPKETTTGAILLRDRDESIIWVQIPKKSMLMNQKLHQRMVDNCQQDEQRIASQSAATAGANAPVLAPSVATAASVAAAEQGSVAKAATVAPGATAVPAAPGASMPVMTTTTTTTTKTTTRIEPPAPVQRGSQAPDAAASGMWK
jgi:hypothetical protein